MQHVVSALQQPAKWAKVSTGQLPSGSLPLLFDASTLRMAPSVALPADTAAARPILSARASGLGLLAQDAAAFAATPPLALWTDAAAARPVLPACAGWLCLLARDTAALAAAPALSTRADATAAIPVLPARAFPRTRRFARRCDCLGRVRFLFHARCRPGFPLRKSDPRHQAGTVILRIPVNMPLALLRIQRPHQFLIDHVAGW